MSNVFFIFYYRKYSRNKHSLLASLYKRKGSLFFLNIFFACFFKKERHYIFVVSASSIFHHANFWYMKKCIPILVGTHQVASFSLGALRSAIYYNERRLLVPKEYRKSRLSAFDERSKQEEVNDFRQRIFEDLSHFENASLEDVYRDIAYLKQRFTALFKIYTSKAELSGAFQDEADLERFLSLCGEYLYENHGKKTYEVYIRMESVQDRVKEVLDYPRRKK